GSLSAQDRPVRPLFGGAYAATEQLLMLTGRFGTGVSRGDRIALTPDVDPTEPHRALSPFLNGDGTLAYTVGRNWFDFDASVTSSTRYYSDEQRTETLNSGRVGLALQKRTARTTVATDLR